MLKGSFVVTQTTEFCIEFLIQDFATHKCVCVYSTECPQFASSSFVGLYMLFSFHVPFVCFLVQFILVMFIYSNTLVFLFSSTNLYENNY